MKNKKGIKEIIIALLLVGFIYTVLIVAEDYVNGGKPQPQFKSLNPQALHE